MKGNRWVNCAARHRQKVSQVMSGGRKIFLPWKVRIAFMSMLACLANASVAIAGVPAIHFGADWRDLDIHTCTGEAMEAMSNQHFITAIKEQVTTWGFNEQSIVLVRCVEQNQGVYIEVLAASRSSQEAERLRNEIRTRVFGAPRADPNMMYPDRINGDSGAFGAPSRVRNFPPMHWGYDTRPKSQQACMRDAQAAMSSIGLQSTPDGNSLVWGTSSEVTVLVSCVPINGGVSILVAATSADGATAERFRNAVRARTFDRPPLQFRHKF
jgi:hypothetical protein